MGILLSQMEEGAQYGAKFHPSVERGGRASVVKFRVLGRRVTLMR